MEEFIKNYGPLVGLIGGLAGLWTWAINEWQKHPRLAVEIRTDPGWSYVKTSPSVDHAVLTATITNRSSVPNAVLKYELASRKKDSNEFDWFTVEQGTETIVEDQEVTVREFGVVPLNLPARTASTAHVWIAIKAANYPDPMLFDLRVTDMWGNVYSSSGVAAIKKNRTVGDCAPVKLQLSPESRQEEEWWCQRPQLGYEARLSSSLGQLAVPALHDSAWLGPFEQLVGAAFSLIESEKRGFSRKRYNPLYHPMVQRKIVSLLEELEAGQESTEQSALDSWLSRYYFNSSIQRMTFAAERLVSHSPLSVQMQHSLPGDRS